MVNKCIKHVWWWLLGIVFLCVLCVAVIPIAPWRLGLERKDFVTALIALGGVVGVVISIFQTQKRITQQEDQQRDARFASGVELLGNTHESARIGGAYNLYFLARDHEEYRTPVCEILCAHIRTLANKEKFPKERYEAYPINEVQTIVDLLFRKFELGTSVFKDEQKDLKGILLYQISFMTILGVTTLLHNVNFYGTALYDVNFISAELYNTSFAGARLDKVSFTNTKFVRGFFNETSLDEVDFRGAELNEIGFGRFDKKQAVLKNVHFENATLNKIDLYDAHFENVYFDHTRLHDFSYDEITPMGASLALTS